MHDSGFEKLTEILRQLTGIELPRNGKNLTLVSSRLTRILEKRGVTSYGDYAEMLRRNEIGVQQEFIDAMTTNTTQFFREQKHFEVLVEIFQQIRANHPKEWGGEFRIWCAASSRGHEAYTILMTLFSRDLLKTGEKIKLLASDIDMNVLKDAARAVYTMDEVKNVPADLRMRFFTKLSGGDDQSELFQVKSALRQCVTFAPFNLVKGTYNFSKKFDFIFCRNVLIYFSPEEASNVIMRLASQLTPGGFLFVGHCETGLVRAGHLKAIAHGVYRRE